MENKLARKPLSEEHKQKLRDAVLRDQPNKGITINVSQEARLKMSEKMKGRIFSDEHKANLSKAIKGRIMPQEFREAVSKGMIGKNIYHPPRSEEVKLAQSNRMKEWWKNLPEDKAQEMLRAFHNPKYDNTSIEQIVENMLLSLEVKFIKQKRLGKYRVDFFIEHLNIAIDIDGQYWHENTMEEDKLRDKDLENKTGVWVIRIPECNLYNGLAIDTLRTILLEPKIEEQGHKAIRILAYPDERYLSFVEVDSV